MKVWTQAYRPFILGGNVHAPICCDIEPASACIDLGKGYQGMSIVSPGGKIFVVEVITGGIVGSSVSEVQADVSTADEAVMKQQIEDGLRQAENADWVTPQEFWRQLRADK